MVVVVVEAFLEIEWQKISLKGTQETHKEMAFCAKRIDFFSTNQRLFSLFSKKAPKPSTSNDFLSQLLYFSLTYMRTDHQPKVRSSDGSVNSCSWKIHTRKQFSAFHEIMFHFHSLL